MFQEDMPAANPGYALAQIAGALNTATANPDPAARERAQKKIDHWLQTIEGMASGSLSIGSRTPVSGVPAWATTQVMKGGFATGELLAGGPLQPHEEFMLQRNAGGETARGTLNGYFLTEDGLAELQQMLTSGQYRVNVPEEGALLTVAWLVKHGNIEAALPILTAIIPFLDKLRFYPVPDERPLSTNSVISLETVSETIEALSRVRTSDQVRKQHETIKVWLPLYDRALALFAETVEGRMPYVAGDHEGKAIVQANGKLLYGGGWPCQTYPHGWFNRARQLLSDYRAAREEHTLCGDAPQLDNTYDSYSRRRPSVSSQTLTKDKPARSENFGILLEALRVCVQDPTRLTGKDVGLIRSILAAVNNKRGLPGSDQCQRLRSMQSALVSGPGSQEWAVLIKHRMEGLAQDQGVDSLDHLLAPVSPEETDQFSIAAGLTPPNTFRDKLVRCLNQPLDALVEQGLISSGEVLAQVIPKITAQIRSADIEDPDLQRLYAAIYQSFRKRRSVLLLNLQHQVQVTELPWVSAIEGYRTHDAKHQNQAALKEIVTMAITAWPHQILPNQLLQEIAELAKAAGLDVPIVEEIASDIFMGEFSPKFLQAAKQAAALMAGTLYERYFGISYHRVAELPDPISRRRYGTPPSAFASLCAELAGEKLEGWGGTARNGKIIEQEMIITTHNLAPLFAALELKDELASRLGELAMRAFEHVCRTLQQDHGHHQANLQALKNAAYAWRQMIFLSSLMTSEALKEFMLELNSSLANQPEAFRSRFKPALAGLFHAWLNRPVENPHGPPGTLGRSHRFLGWTTGQHFLMS